MDKLPVDKLEELKQLEMLKEDCEFAIKCDRYIPRVDTRAIKALIEDAIDNHKTCVWCEDLTKNYHNGTHFVCYCDYSGRKLE